MLLKGFSVFSSGGHLVYPSRTILSILVGSKLSIIPVKSESNLHKGLGGDSILKQIINVVSFSALAVILFIRAEQF